MPEGKWVVLPKLRKIHLYLGCVFAPMLILFIVTGCLQTFGLHEPNKGGYTPAPIVYSLSEVHIHQRFASPDSSLPSSFLLKIFIILMSIGLLATTLLGIFMAFKVTKNKLLVWLSLLSGIVLPILFLWIGIVAK
jgi:hypothetical protein